MLTEKVRETVFEFLGLMRTDGAVPTFGYSRASISARDRELLRCLLKSRTITREEVREFIHQALITSGRKCYEHHQESDVAPDHFHPKAFAYAISNDEFSYQELQEVRFDHSDTPTSFVRTYGCSDGGRRLLDQLVESVLKPKKQPSLVFSDCEVCC